ncbi:MAG: hypothetical protein EXR85_10305 [Xanthomonadales bacterium]|nr:hypothetical protein [Xanthomonadales bacterium]
MTMVFFGLGTLPSMLGLTLAAWMAYTLAYQQETAHMHH